MNTDDREWIVAHAVATAKAQGLPEFVDNAAALARMAEIVRADRAASEVDHAA